MGASADEIKGLEALDRKIAALTELRRRYAEELGIVANTSQPQPGPSSVTGGVQARRFRSRKQQVYEFFKAAWSDAAKRVDTEIRNTERLGCDIPGRLRRCLVNWKTDVGSRCSRAAEFEDDVSKNSRPTKVLRSKRRNAHHRRTGPYQHGGRAVPFTTHAHVAELAYAAGFSPAALDRDCGCKSHRAHSHSKHPIVSSATENAVPSRR